LFDAHRVNRRTTAQAKTDDAAFPVRVKIVVPRFGLGRSLDAIERWLRDHVGKGNFACHSAPGIGTDTMAVHFRNVDIARSFVAAFPDLELADGTISIA
jgi:hypothetical protein